MTRETLRTLTLYTAYTLGLYALMWGLMGL